MTGAWPRPRKATDSQHNACGNAVAQNRGKIKIPMMSILDGRDKSNTSFICMLAAFEHRLKPDTTT